MQAGEAAGMHRPDRPVAVVVATAVSPWTLPADLRKAIWEGGAGGGFRQGEYHPPGYQAV